MNPASPRPARREPRLAVLSLLAAFLLLPACSKHQRDRADLPNSSSPQPTPVRVVKPAATAQSGENRVTCTVRPKSEATRSAKTTGQILTLDTTGIAEGQPVRAVANGRRALRFGGILDPIKLFIRRPIFTSMLVVALVVFGLFA